MWESGFGVWGVDPKPFTPAPFCKLGRHVKEHLPFLLKLSAMDIKIHELVESQTEIPLTLRQIQADILGLQGEITSKEQELEKIGQQKNICEDLLQQKKTWLENRDPAIKSLKTNKEYQLALKEMASAKKEITDRDTQLMDLLTKMTDLQKSIADLKQKNEPRIVELQNLLEEHKSKLSQLDAVIHQEESIRRELASQVDPGVLDLYERSRARGVPVLSKCDAGICEECSTRLPPQHANQVVQGKELLLCPRCKRILYAEENLPVG